MHSYHLRVELHNSALADYTTLHLAMEKAGFSRTILANDNKRYYLPTAEYVILTQSALADVVATAKAAANTTRRTSSIFAVEYTTWRADSLVQVR